MAIAAALAVSGTGPVHAGDGDEQPIGIILAAGDIANCQSSRSRVREVTDLIEREIANGEARGLPVGVIALGDLAYKISGGGTVKKAYKTCFEEFSGTWGTFKDSIYPIPGNHDYTDDEVHGAGTLFSYFSDFYDRVPAKSDGGSYLEFFPRDHPNAWTLVGFNYYADRKAELRFAEKALSEARPGCVLGFSHPFYYSSGHHGQGSPKMTDEKMGGFFRPLANAHGSLLLTAHDHHFEQFAPVDAGGNPNETGVRQFVVGTGGAPLYKRSEGKFHARSEFYQQTTHGVLKLELFADSYSWSFLPVGDADPAQFPSGHADCNRP